METTREQLTFTVLVPHVLTAEDLTDILITAIEGGINYWCPKIRLRTAQTCCDVCGRDLKDDAMLENEGNYFCREKCLSRSTTWDVSLWPRDTVVTDRREGEVWNEYICRNVIEGGTLTFYERVDDAGYQRRIMTRDKLLSGIEQALVICPNAGITLDDVDAVAADLIVQCALLKDVVYG
jgi:hypothetical protein